jgi:hypothetical protein
MTKHQPEEGLKLPTFGRRKVAARVCVVDGKPHVRKFLCEALEEIGFITRECAAVLLVERIERPAGDAQPRRHCASQPLFSKIAPPTAGGLAPAMETAFSGALTNTEPIGATTSWDCRQPLDRSVRALGTRHVRPLLALIPQG